MKPLEGILALEFTNFIAGPYTGAFLSDMGAEVIKIEPPEGAEERRGGRTERYKGNSRMSLTFNRGKKGLCVDLKTEAGKKIVYELVKKADIVIQNYAPGAAEKLGIDYETFSNINDKIIFVSSTAFGESGPYKYRKGFDIIAHGASGIMAGYADEEGNPRGPGGITYIDISTAQFNVMSALAALHHRNQTGKGQKIETSLFNTGMALQISGFLKIKKLDSELHEQMKDVLKNARQNKMKHYQIIDTFMKMRLRHEQPESTRDLDLVECNHRPSDRQNFPYYRVYQVKDGFISVAAISPRHRVILCDAIGIEDKYAHINLGDGNDETYFYQKEVARKMEARFGEKTKDEWIEILEKAGIPCGPINYSVNLFDDPHAIDMNMVWDLENPVSGPYKMVGSPMKFSRTPIQPTKGAPDLGEDTVQILKSIGYDDEHIETLRQQAVVKCPTY